jgi:hypothetical protein
MNSRMTAIVLAAVSCGAAAQVAGVQRPARAGDVAVYSAEMRSEKARYDETVTVLGVEGDRIRSQHQRTDKTAPTEGLYTRDWGTLRSGTTGVVYEAPAGGIVQPLEVGRSSEGVYQGRNPAGAQFRIKLESTVAAREKLATPAGEFDAFRIESRGYLSGLSFQGGFAFVQKQWYAPAIDRIVRYEYKEQRTMGADNFFELKAFRPAD